MTNDEACHRVIEGDDPIDRESLALMTVMFYFHVLNNIEPKAPGKVHIEVDDLGSDEQKKPVAIQKVTYEINEEGKPPNANG